MGQEVDIENPTAVAEFLCPQEDWEKKNKISLYDLLDYLVSKERSSLTAAIAMDLPYIIEKVHLNNKFKALARLECNFLNYDNEGVLYYLKHTEYDYENGKIVSVPMPDILCNKKITDYVTNPNDPVIAYIRGLFQDKEMLRGSSILGFNISLYDNSQQTEDKKKSQKN